MNSDNVKGKLKDLGGKAQEATGKATGNPNLEAKGDANQVEGKVQNAWGNVKKEARDMKDDIKSSIDKHKAENETATATDTTIDRDEVA